MLMATLFMTSGLIFHSFKSTMKSVIPDGIFGCLIFFTTTWVVRAIAPDDRHDICRTNFRYRVAHDWIPYANDTSSGTWKVLLDQYDYQNILGTGIPSGVWTERDIDGDGKQVNLGYYY